MIASCTTLLASEPVYVNLLKHFSEQNGLPTNNVYHLMEDTNGRLWVSGDRGVSVYNGIDFETFTPDDGLVDYEVLSTFQSRDGRIWMATFNGKVGYYDGRHFKQIAHQTLPHFGPIRAFSEVDSNLVVTPVRGSSILISMDGQGLHSLSGSAYPHTMLFERHGSTDEYVSVAKNDTILGQIKVETPHGSRVFYGRYVGVPFYDGLREIEVFSKNGSGDIVLEQIDTEKLRLLRSAVLPSLEGSVPLTFLKADKFLLIGTRNGLYVFDAETLELKVRSLEHLTITSIIRLRDESLWLSTLENGIFEFALDAYVRKTSEQPAYRFVRSDGRLFACGIGQVLEVEDLQVKKLQVEGMRERITDVEVIGGDLLTSSGIGIFMLRASETRHYDCGGGLKDIERLGDSVFVGAYNGIFMWPLNELDKLDKLHYNPERIVSDRANTVCWFKDSLLFGNERGVYNLHLAEPTPGRSLDYSGRVNRIMNGDECVFIATATDGVYKSNLSGTISHFLEGRTIHQVNWVNGNLWCVLDNEIALYHEGRLSFFSQFELNIEGKLNDVTEDEGYVLVASSGGLYRLPLESFLHPNKRVRPGIYLDQFTVNGQDRDLPVGVALKHKENNLRFEFESVYFRSTAKLVFQYSLVNRSTGETFEYKSTSGSHALYNLSPGNYLFEVHAVSGSVESDQLAYAFEIKRPFYDTPLFWIVLIVFLGSVAAFVLRLRVVGLKKEQQRVHELYEFEQQALRAKMNPHFLFNVLNSIQQFFLRDDGMQGHKYLKRFAELVRLVLKNTDKTYVTIEEELDYLKRYVELEQLRSNAKFEFRVDVVQYDQVKKFPIPSMTIQPFIENSIWHAFKGDDVGVIWLKMSLKQGDLHVVVEDDGLGFDPHLVGSGESDSKGIVIVKERLEVLKKHGHKGLVLCISSEKGQGTRVELIIPKER